MKAKVFKILTVYLLLLIFTIIYSVFIKDNAYEETLDYIGLCTFIYVLGLLIELIVEGIRRNK